MTTILLAVLVAVSPPLMNFNGKLPTSTLAALPTPCSNGTLYWVSDTTPAQFRVCIANAWTTGLDMSAGGVSPVLLQSAYPGAQQIGGINVSGSIITKNNIQWLVNDGSINKGWAFLAPDATKLEINTQNDDGSNAQTQCQWNQPGGGIASYSCVSSIQATGFKATGGGTQLLLNDESGNVGNKLWRVETTGTGGTLHTELCDDGLTACADYYTLTRSGNTPGTLTLSSALTVSGAFSNSGHPAGAWSAETIGLAVVSQNYTGAYKSAASANKFRNIACSWGTAGVGGTTGYVIAVRNVSDSSTLCTCTLGACTTAANTPLACDCNSASLAAKLYTLRTDSNSDCATEPQNIICNVEMTLP